MKKGLTINGIVDEVGYTALGYPVYPYQLESALASLVIGLPLESRN